MRNENVNKSILRAFDILNLFSPSVHELGISEIAEKLCTNRSTIVRLVSTLTSLNYLRKSEKNSKYCLGGKIAGLVKAYFATLDLKQLAHPFMVELCEKTEETVTLSVLENDTGFYLSWVDSPKRIRMVIEEQNIQFELHAGAPGKLLLAYLPESTVKDIVEKNGLPRFTDRTITNYDVLAAELAEVREKGLAISRGEHIEYGCTISAPVRDFSGKVAAALSVTWVSLGNDTGQEDDFGLLLKETAGNLSEVLGYYEQY